MHAIAHYIEFEHIKGKDSVLAGSLSRLRHLGLHHDNDPEEPVKNMANQFLKQMKTSYIVLIMIKIQMINSKLNDKSIFLARMMLITHKLALQVLILYHIHVI